MKPVEISVAITINNLEGQKCAFLAISRILDFLILFYFLFLYNFGKPIREVLLVAIVLVGIYFNFNL